MNLRQAHKKAEHERIKREIMNIIERRLIFDVTIGMKAVFLLALKKRRMGQTKSHQTF